MASPTQVRQFLAYWFQLGKQLIIGNGQHTIHPRSVIAGDRYSAEFESCWEQALCYASTSYLEGTHFTLSELLSPSWDIVVCARCPMPVPMKVAGLPSGNCPCHDLPTWPNLETIVPHAPLNTRERLMDICNRLNRCQGKDP
ncbi:MAG: hypothetical protein VKJ24_05420 [Synechococcales bacterium]|nr:hypothetical protein [Synechococcales bacterium]